MWEAHIYMKMVFHLALNKELKLQYIWKSLVPCHHYIMVLFGLFMYAFISISIFVEQESHITVD